MGRTIAIVNDKGGVSKTTTAANLGTALWLLGRRVLLVDADRQCNLTVTLDRTAYAPGVATLREWMRGEAAEPPVYERYPGLDYVPGSVRLDELNAWLLDRTGRENYLTLRLAPLRPEYDYIIIDCAPGCSSVLNRNAVAAADAVIVPVRADLYSVQGKDAVSAVVGEVNAMLGRRVELMGYLLTQYEGTRLGREVRDFFRGAEAGGAPLLPVPIRKCARCAEAPKEQMTLYELAPECTAADDYMRLAERLEGREPRRPAWTPQAWGRKARRAHEAFLAAQAGAAQT